MTSASGRAEEAAKKLGVASTAGLPSWDSIKSGLPSWDSIKSGLPSFGGPESKSAGTAYPTLETLKRSASSVGDTLRSWAPSEATLSGWIPRGLPSKLQGNTPQSARGSGYLPTLESLKGRASQVGDTLRGWVPGGLGSKSPSEIVAGLPSAASLVNRLPKVPDLSGSFASLPAVSSLTSAVSSHVPSIASLRARLPSAEGLISSLTPKGLSSEGWRRQLSALNAKLKAKLPTLESLAGTAGLGGLTASFKGGLPALPDLASLQGKVPSLETVRTRAWAGAGKLGGYARKASGGTDASHDGLYGLGLVALAALALLFGLRLKDTATGSTSSAVPVTRSLPGGPGGPQNPPEVGRDLPTLAPAQPTAGPPGGPGGTFSLVDSVMAGGGMGPGGSSVARSLPADGLRSAGGGEGTAGGVLDAAGGGTAAGNTPGGVLGTIAQVPAGAALPRSEGPSTPAPIEAGNPSFRD